jgi:hypothetical protein
MYIYTFLLRTSDTITTQNTDLYSWDTLDTYMNLHTFLYILREKVTRKRQDSKGKDTSKLERARAKALQDLHIRNGKMIQKKTPKKTNKM